MTLRGLLCALAMVNVGGASSPSPGRPDSAGASTQAGSGESSARPNDRTCPAPPGSVARARSGSPLGTDH
jgi:hypothetical protein